MERKQAQDNQARLDWLGLRLIPGVGSVRFMQLVEAFGSPSQVLEAGPAQLRKVKGLPIKVTEAIVQRSWKRSPQEELKRLVSLGARAVILGDADYPPLLKQVYAPPPVLYVRGDLEPCHSGGVAVVGSRKVSRYGMGVANDLGRDLARAGVSLVSGLARGIDTAAHQSSLEQGGHTVGVQGCGLDWAYPPENADLISQMAQSGAVVTEFPLGTPPAAGNFPVRNRIISGLSRAVVVVEATQRSGALITARHALDQGREVFAVPGPVGTAGAEGSNNLIRQGARLLTSAQDLLEPGALPVLLEEEGQGEPALPDDLPASARQLFDLLGAQPVHLDVLVRESGLAVQEVSALLTTLELYGLVFASPGNNFSRS
jgi:DNA processing protein